jgi:CHAT domain-containing protein/predicted negative regulator of RcsB-dependent stress response
MLIQNMNRFNSFLKKFLKRSFLPVILGFTSLCLAVISPILTSINTPVQAAVPAAASPISPSSTADLNPGRTLYAAGRFAEAATSWSTMAQTYAARNDRPNQALSLSYLSLAYQELNQWDAARKAIDESLSLLQGSQSNILLAQTLNTQARLLSHTGQSEQALEKWEQAQKYYEQAGDRLGAMGTQVNRAQALQTLGFYGRSRQLLEATRSQLADLPDSDVKISQLRNLGSVLQSTGDLSGSRTALEESLAIAQRLDARTELGSILLSLGKTAVDAGALEAALTYFQQSEQSAVNPLVQIQARINQLNLYADHVAEIDPALWYPVEALAFETYEQLLKLPPSRMSIYGAINLVANLSRLSDPQQPIPSEKLAELMAFVVQSAKDLKDVRAEAYSLAQWGQLYARNQQWQEANDLTQQALTIAQQLQAQDIIAQSSWQLGRILRQQGKRVEAIASYTEAVNSLKSLRGDLVAINSDVQFSFRESVEPVYRQLVDLLLDDRPSQDALVQARGLIESLQLAELDNFFREACLDGQSQQIDQIDAQASVVYPILLPDRLAVIVSNPGQPLHFYATPGEQADTEQTLRDLLASINPVEDKVKRLQRSQQVYDWLIRPAEAEGVFAKTKTLVFILDGLLRKVPLAALYDGEKYLIEKYAVALSPGLQLMASRSLNSHEIKAIVGGISEAREGFAALPAVKSEVEQISKLVSASTLLNQEFTGAALARQLQRNSANIVHLATHGQFSSKQEDTFLLTWEGRINVKELSELLRSRADRSSQAIDLLVLSACDTAAGDDRATLGLAGLAVKSGARATLATLWPVKDKAAALLMDRFYHHISEPGISKAEALQKAQVEIITETDFNHPFFWSTFVLVGNWL